MKGRNSPLRPELYKRGVKDPMFKELRNDPLRPELYKRGVKEPLFDEDVPYVVPAHLNEASVSKNEDEGEEESESEEKEELVLDEEPEPPISLIHFLKRTSEVNEDSSQTVQSSEVEILITQLNQILSHPEFITLRNTSLSSNRAAKLKRYVKGLVGLLLFATFITYGLWFSITQSLEALGGMISAGSALLYVLL